MDAEAFLVCYMDICTQVVSEGFGLVVGLCQTMSARQVEGPALTSAACTTCSPRSVQACSSPLSRPNSQQLTRSKPT